MHVLALCGSLRAGSFNRGLLRAAAELAPEGVRVEVAEIGDVPPYKEDLEPRGWPAPVAALRDRGATVSGVDLSPDMVALARERLGEAVPGS